MEIDDGSSLEDFVNIKRDPPERSTIKQWYQQRHPNTHRVKAENWGASVEIHLETLETPKPDMPLYSVVTKP